MPAASTVANWPRGTLRSFESTASISAKLAIYNSVSAVHYEQEVDSRSLGALARLLREPLPRVRDALERPPWVSGMDALIEKSFILREVQMRAESGYLWLPRHRYCNDCMNCFYHSWMHDLSWLDHCFVHRATLLTKVPTCRHGKNPAVEHLHDAWRPSLAKYIRTPHDFDEALARLSNRRLRGAVRALGAMFVPSSCDLGPTASFKGHPMALDATCSMDDASQAAPPDRKAVADRAVIATNAGHRAGALPTDTAKDAATGRPVAPASDPSHEDDRSSLASDETPSSLSPASGVATMARVQAGTRSALACAVASAARQTTDNLLTRHHGEFQGMRFLGQARFASFSKRPNFWRHLAYVLATGGQSAERTLIESFISRLSHRHEDCLSALKSCHERQDHLEFSDDAPHTDYVAYHLRGHGICPRLLTLDLVTRMLRSAFLCPHRQKTGAKGTSQHEDDDWIHAGLHPHRLFASHEWLAYEQVYEDTLVYPSSAKLAHFTHTLGQLEWAFFRRERLGYSDRSLDHVLREILFDQRLVSVGAKTPASGGRPGDSLYVYFGLDGGGAPDWDELARSDTFHVQRTARVLKELRTPDLYAKKWMRVFLD